MLTRSGDDLFSVTTESPQDAQALANQLRDSGDWLEVIPGIDSVVLQFDAATYDGDDVRQTIESALAAGIEPLQISQSLVEIPVIYGGEYGPDLNALCEKIGLSADDVIALHTGREYTVDMIGFTPGFAFIGDLDERLRVPRRKEPRQRVEAGSVGIADERTGLYAMASPGGWTIIGRTPSRLFDPNAEQPFVLGAGTRVRFTAISADELNG
ncbi:MAG: 5-oxoprolinase subunit PxpB [Gammaproteobacteria bacterium]|nr:5-oxoprolinase subunit PxpB [Gammaproteobacteria bacterium]